MALGANVELANSFNEWRIRTNEILEELKTNVLRTGNTATGNVVLSGWITASGVIVNSNGNITTTADGKFQLRNSGSTAGVVLNVATDGTLLVRNRTDGANGHIQGANITASGNVAGVNVSATANVSAVNVVASGTVGAANMSATANVNAVNVIASGNTSAANMTATANVQGARIVSTGNVHTGASGTILFGTRGIISSPADGKFQLANNAGTAGVLIDVSTDARFSVRNRANTDYADVFARQGYFASVQLPSGVPADTTDKVYNDSGTLKFNGAPIGGRMFMVFGPQHNNPPASSYATPDVRNSHPVLDFDASSDERAIFPGVLSPDYGNGDIEVTLVWAASTATSGNVVWAVAFERINDESLDIDAESFATAVSATAAAPATSGQVQYTTITFTSSQIDGLAAGEAFRLNILRDADNASDTMTGDAELVRVIVREV